MLNLTTLVAFVFTFCVQVIIAQLKFFETL